MSVVANVAINVDSRNAVSKLRQVQTQAQATEKAFGALQSAIGALGVGFALTKVIADVKELDTNLRRLGTVGGNVAALDKGLGALSDRLDGVANKAELAAASYQALSAGFTDTASNLKVVETATKAAVGGLVDVASVVEVTTKTLNAYNMSGDQAIKVTDSISKAIEFGQVQWSDYTSQLGRVASIAATAGVSLDEVNAFIAAATKNGATAEVAFTGLGSTLATILKPTKESADAAKILGINWTLAGVRGEGFESLMGKLAKAMQENPVLATEMVGGQEAIRGAFAAAAKGGADYKMILEGLGGAAGKTDADFQTMKGSLENTLKALDTSFKNLSEALGTAFGPTVVAAIDEASNAINGIAIAINAMPQPLKTATAETVKLIAQFLLLQKAIQITIGLQTALTALTIKSNKLNVATTAGSSAFALYTKNAAALAPKVAGTTVLLGNLKGAMLAIPGAGWTAAAIIGLGLLAKAVFDTNETFRNFVKNIGGVIASDFRSAVDGMADDAKDSAANIQKAYEELLPRLSPIAKFIRELFKGAFKDTSNAAEKSAAASSNAFADFFNGLVSQGAAAFNGLSSLIANWWNSLPGPIRNILAGNTASILVGAAGYAGDVASRASAPNAQTSGMFGKYIPGSSQVAIPASRKTEKPKTLPGGGGSAAGGGASRAADDAKRAAEAAERAAEKKRRAAEELANLQGQVALKEKLFAIDKQIAVEKERGSLVTAAALEMDKALEEREARIAEITRSTVDQATKNAQIKDATLDADQKIYAVQQAIKEQEIERTRAFDQTIADLDLELALKTATTEQAREQLRLEAEIARIRGDKNLTPEQQQAIIGRKTELARPKTDKERLQGAADEVRLELEKLTDPINAITTAAAGIGDAFGTSFKGIISGSMTAKEALANFFTSVADMFLDMAAQIIAKWIQMTILNTILQLFPGGSGGSGGGLGSSQFKPGSGAQLVPSLPGAKDYSGVFKKRAKGGSVSSGQTYMVGERGPELFVPGRSGTIVANDKMGGGNTNVVVNVDAKGSSVEGDEQGANQLGRVISAAVQSELIKQQRPGGILAR